LPSLDLDGGLLVCAWVDAHTHLDKGHILPRTGDCGGDLRGRAQVLRARQEWFRQCAFRYVFRCG
jgi:cytosine/creatinine deaminase